MSPRLRQLSGREVLRVLERFGFVVVAVRGSHAKVRRVVPGGQRQTLTIPLHKDLASGTLRAILRQAARFIPEHDLRPWFFEE